MGIFRGILIGFLVLWLSLPMPLLISPEMVRDEVTDRATMSVLLNQQQRKPYLLRLWHQLKSKSQGFPGIKPTLLMGRIVFDDWRKTKASIEGTLFYLWQTLIKPTRQILWQMTSQMQRFLIKNIAAGYSRAKFLVCFEDLIYRNEIVLDPAIS